MKILVVDDAVAIRRQVIKVLQDLGFKEILEAGNVSEAWSLIVNNAGIRLIFSDWHMPGESGLDLLKRVRSDARYKDTAFIMLTTEQEKDKIVQAARFVLQGYLFKPVNRLTIQQRLASLGISSTENL